MSRNGTYKMQAVLRYFQAAPFDWATRADPVLRNARWTFVVLACGHIKRDSWETYQNETAVRVRAVLHHAFSASDTRRVRCHECVTGRPQIGRPVTIPPESEQVTCAKDLK